MKEKVLKAWRAITDGPDSAWVRSGSDSLKRTSRLIFKR